MKTFFGTLCSLGLMLAGLSAAETKSLPKPDGKPADMTKPVQVFILLGQSNMVGLGKVTGDRDIARKHHQEQKEISVPRR